MHSVEKEKDALKELGPGSRIERKKEEMNTTGSVLLLCSAIFTCLALGVLMAYGICLTMFAILRQRTMLSLAKPAPSVNATSGM